MKGKWKLRAALFLCLAAWGCSDMIADQEGDAAVTGWISSDRVTNLAAMPDTGSVTLTWIDPTAAFERIEVTWSPGGSAAQSVAAGTRTFTATGLSVCTAYTFTVRAVLADGSYGGDAAVTMSTGIAVGSAAELDDVRNDLTACYSVTADIDLSGYNSSGGGWEPIGDMSTHFTGTLDGNGHTIGNLTIHRSISELQGLFGYIGSGGVVRNCVLTGGSVTGYNFVGLLAGLNFGTVNGSYASGNVSGKACVGGLVGDNEGTVNGSYATGTVSGGDLIGGLVGFQATGCFLTNCYATGNVSGAGNSIGGLVGYNDGTVSSSYYCRSNNGIGSYVTEVAMRQQSTYTGWDFTTIWGIDPSINGGFPYLRGNMP
ncbi:MAG: fibronectin type III domain-containing protein [Spirochaetes bacterium]|nr:fibronectin type III domain-containing protein [Spirochaetota bacterium]